MTLKILVAYDGSAASRRAVTFAIDRAKLTGASIILAHVLEWSPYAFLTKEELEIRHKRREEELVRAKEAIIQPLLEDIGDEVKIEVVTRFGGIAETISKIAIEKNATQIVAGRHGAEGMKARVLGSRSSKLVQISTVPCTIVP